MYVCKKCGKATAEKNHYTGEMKCYNRYCSNIEGGPMKELDDLVKKVSKLEAENVRMTEKLHNIMVTLTAVHSDILSNNGVCSQYILEEIKNIVIPETK